MTEKKISPYRVFKDWLLNSYPNAKLSEETLKAINPKSVLHMFGSLGGITIYLDEYFNNFELMKCNPIEFYDFLKQLVQKHHIGKYDFSFFISMKRDKGIKEIQRKLPLLKKYEIYDLIERCKEDEENKSFLENLGLLKKSKMKKIPKTKKKSKKNVPKEALTFEDTFIKDVKTMEDLKRLFNLVGGDNENR